MFGACAREWQSAPKGFSSAPLFPVPHLVQAGGQRRAQGPGLRGQAAERPQDTVLTCLDPRSAEGRSSCEPGDRCSRLTGGCCTHAGARVAARLARGSRASHFSNTISAQSHSRGTGTCRPVAFS